MFGIVLEAYPALDGGVPVIFDGVVGPSGQQFGNMRPLVAIPTSCMCYCLCA